MIVSSQVVDWEVTSAWLQEKRKEEIKKFSVYSIFKLYTCCWDLSREKINNIHCDIGLFQKEFVFSH